MPFCVPEFFNIPFLNHIFFLHFNKNAEFTITNTEPALCTSAPTIRFSMPVTARTIATKLSAIENVRLHFMVVIIRFDNRIKCGSSLTSSSTRAISAASTAKLL